MFILQTLNSSFKAFLISQGTRVGDRDLIIFALFYIVVDTLRRDLTVTVIFLRSDWLRDDKRWAMS